MFFIFIYSLNILISDGTRVGDSCTTSLDTCIDDNAGCNGTVCDCLPGFTYNGSICSK